eukprot:g10777.t1
MADSTKYDVTFGPGPMGFGVETPDGKEEGSIVTEVVDGGAAEKGGVKTGDFLVGIGDEDITHLDHESTVELIIEAERPVVLHFEKPKDTKKDVLGDEVAKAPVLTQVAVPFPVLDAEYEIIGVVKAYMKTMSKEQAKNPVESVKEV